MVDLSFLESFTKGNPEKMKRYIQIYLKTAPGIFDNMAQNIRDKDFEQLRINAHSLKPQADYMGISILKSFLVDIEQSVLENKRENIDELYEKALRVHKKSTPLLQGYMDTL